MRHLTLGLAIFALIGMMAVPGLSKGNQGQAGKSNIAHADLADVTGGMAWGKVKYNLSGPVLDYVLNAKGLVPGNSYEVRTAGNTIGSGVADEDGNLHVNTAADGDLIGNRLNVWDVTGTETRILRTEPIGFVYTP